MKRTLSILVAVLLATSLVWGATLLDTNSGGFSATANDDPGPTSASSSENSGASTATYGSMYVEVDFYYEISGASPYASCGVSASFDNESTYPYNDSDSITTGTESGTSRLPSSGTVSADIADVWVKVTAGAGGIPSDSLCSVIEWRIYNEGRRIIVITGG